MAHSTATLGALERALMDALWDADGKRTAYELQEVLGDGAPAVTTVLTVLGRLEKKGFVTVKRRSRPHHYEPTAARADYMAELMHQVLVDGSDHQAVLERFVGGVSPADAETLRHLLQPRA